MRDEESFTPAADSTLAAAGGDVRWVPLGRRSIGVYELPFRVLKRVIPRLNSVAANVVDGSFLETDLDKMLEVVSLASGVPVPTLEAAVIPIDHLASAIKTIAEINHLEGDKGNAPAAATDGSHGTTSMPSSPLPPDGPGPSSTS